jgi:predicted phage terminase large subunit-like protein
MMKSISATVAFPAYLLGHDPSCKIIATSYSQKLSFTHSMDTRRVVESEWYREIFPSTILAKDQNEKSKFATTEQGMRMAASVGSTITGMGGDVLLCDDPHDPGQALSDVQRETAINWFDQTLSTRLNNRKTGVIIVVMQRLHQGDLSGHLLEMGGWEHLCLRGIEDENRVISFGGFKKVLRPGDLLHEDRVGNKEIEELKKQLKHGFAGQILQRPTPQGGGVIQLDWFGRYNIAPTEHKRITQSWDTAFKANAGSDYSVCTTWLETDKGHYLVDVFRKQMEYPDLKRSFVAMRDKWQPNVILVEDKASGQSLLQDFANNGQFNTVPIKVDKDKVTRAGTASDLIEAGNVYLPNRADWLIDLETEIESFPNGVHDDMVDSMSQYLNWVRLKGMIQPRIRIL